MQFLLLILGSFFLAPDALAGPALAAVPGWLATGATVLGGLSAAKTLFGGSKEPQTKAATPMPMADDAAVEAAKRRKQIEIQSRSGRASTILSDTGGDKLGG